VFAETHNKISNNKQISWTFSRSFCWLNSDFNSDTNCSPVIQTVWCWPVDLFTLLLQNITNGSDKAYNPHNRLGECTNNAKLVTWDSLPMVTPDCGSSYILVPLLRKGRDCIPYTISSPLYHPFIASPPPARPIHTQTDPCCQFSHAPALWSTHKTFLFAE
jgi:hypothetical protein